MRIRCIGAITVICTSFMIAQEKSSTTQRITFGVNLSRNAIATTKSLSSRDSKVTIAETENTPHQTLSEGNVDKERVFNTLVLSGSVQNSRQLGSVQSRPMTKKVVVTVTE